MGMALSNRCRFFSHVTMGVNVCVSVFKSVLTLYPLVPPTQVNTDKMI